MNRKGFTLIELLVVIAIIALLMSILMPSLAKVKNSAKRVVCQTNQHGLAQAYAAYASENDDRFVLIESAQPWFMTNRSGWDVGWRENRHRFESYTTPDQFYCPAMGKGLGGGITKPDDDNGGNQVGWSARPVGQPGDYYVAVGYSMLAGWGRGRDDMSLKYISSASRGNLNSQAASATEFPTKFSKLKASATAPLLSDIAFTPWPSVTLDEIAETFPWAPYDSLTIWGSSNSTNYALNHVLSGNRVLGINTAFADGHVEWHTDDEILPRAWYTYGEYHYWY